LPHFFMFDGGMSFLFAAIGISMVVRAVRGGGGRRYQEFTQPQQPVMLEDPRVPRLQAELDDLRAQVERISAAESFYAQLQAPAPGSPRPPESPAPPVSPTP